MSLRRIVHEVVVPYLHSVSETAVEDRVEEVLRALQASGAAVPQVAAGMEADDLTSTGLPGAVLRVLAQAIREDILPEGEEPLSEYARLRPRSFDHVIGHDSFKRLMTTAILAAKAEDRPLRHVLLSGPRGLGKTTLATVIGCESRRPVRLHVGSQLRRPQDISTQALMWQDGDIVFIDEIHGMHRSAQEVLYSLMEDGRLPVIEPRRRGAARRTSVPAPAVTIIGATTNPAMLEEPFRNRFGMKYQLSFYSKEELVHIAEQSAHVLGLTFEDGVIDRVVDAARQNPRTLNEFLIQLRDHMVVMHGAEISAQVVSDYLVMNGYDLNGLLPLERQYLDILEQQGGTAGLRTIASAMDVQVSELEQSIEPWLIRDRWIVKTPRGRKRSAKELSCVTM